MYALIGVNTTKALFYRVPGEREMQVDGFECVNSLLQIRSAKGLLEHLRRFPFPIEQSFHALQSGYSRTIDSSHEFEYSEKSMQNAAYKLGIEYLDNMADLGNHLDVTDARMEWYDRLHEGIRKRPVADLYEIHFPRLEIMRQKVESLLLLAAASYGIGGGLAPSFSVVKMNNSSFCNMEVGLPLSCVRLLAPGFRVLEDDALGPFLREAREANGIRVVEPFTDKVSTIGNYVIENGKIVSYQPNDKPIERMAGALVAAALKTMLDASTSDRHIVFDGHAYTESSSNSDPVLDALKQIIFDGRIGVCPVCGKPFVKKKRKDAEYQAKTYCTDNCRVKNANKGR